MLHPKQISLLISPRNFFAILTLFVILMLSSCSDDEASISDFSNKIELLENNQFYSILARVVGIAFILYFLSAIIANIRAWFKKEGKFKIAWIANYLFLVGILYLFEYFGWMIFESSFIIWVIALVCHLVDYLTTIIIMKIDDESLSLLLIGQLISILILFLIGHFFIDQIIILNFFASLIVFCFVIEFGQYLGGLFMDDK